MSENILLPQYTSSIESYESILNDFLLPCQYNRNENQFFQQSPKETTLLIVVAHQAGRFQMGGGETTSS
jgi:hypothetical protein